MVVVRVRASGNGRLARRAGRCCRGRRVRPGGMHPPAPAALRGVDAGRIRPGVAVPSPGGHRRRGSDLPRRGALDGSAPVRTAKRVGPGPAEEVTAPAPGVAGRAPRARGCPACPRRLPTHGPGTGPGGGAAVTDPRAGARGDSPVGSALARIRGGTGPVGRDSRRLPRALPARAPCPQRPPATLSPPRRRVRRGGDTKGKRFIVKGEREK